MDSIELFNDGQRRWVWFGRDPRKPDTIIDTNEYLVMDGHKGLLIDPGGMEVFGMVAAAISAEVRMEDIEAIFASHQDPDVVSSLWMWIELCGEHLVTYGSWIWGSFIPHFGSARPISPIPDEGMNIPLGASRDLVAVPAHYCHSAGNFSLYDPTAKILFSGDMGAALLPAGHTGVFVEDFDSHVQYMEGFHRRWMPSDAAKNRWVERVRELDVNLMCPQHGAIFRGDNVARFLDWFEALEVGTAVEAVAAGA